MIGVVKKLFERPVKVELSEAEVSSIRGLAHEVMEDPTRITCGEIGERIRNSFRSTPDADHMDAGLTLFCTLTDLPNPTNHGATAHRSILEQLKQPSMVVKLRRSEHEVNRKF